MAVLSFEHDGWVRSTQIVLPRTFWDEAYNPRPLVLHLSPNVGAVFRGDFDIVNTDDPVFKHAVLLYPDPLPMNVEGGSDPNRKWNNGTVGNSGWIIDVDDVGFLLEVLHRTRMMLNNAWIERYEQVGEPVPEGFEVLDDEMMFLVGTSVGGCMCYRMLREAPLTHPDDPTFQFKFAAAAVYAATVGGYRRTMDIGDSAFLVDNSPHHVDTPLVAPASILHLHGALDQEVGNRDRAAWVLDSAGNLGVRSEENRIQFESVQPPFIAATLARWDLVAEHGLDRWLAYNDGVPPADRVAPNLNPYAPIPGAYDSTGSVEARIATFSARGAAATRLAFWEVLGEGHPWPKSFDTTKLILDFFKGAYP